MNRFFQTLSWVSLGCLILMTTRCTKSSPVSGAGPPPRVFISAHEADAKAALTEVELEAETQIPVEMDPE